MNFDHEFDKKLVMSIEKHGIKWNLIAKELEICDAVKLKNRFYNHIKRKGLYDQILQEL